MTKGLWITVGAMRTLLLALSLAGSALPFADWARASNGEAPPLEEKQEAPPAALVTIDISFKLDPRLTRGLYMGDRWVSPPTYSLNQPGKSATVDVRVGGVDATGRRVEIDPTWIAADPEMVTVTPTEGSEVEITIHRAGESQLRVSAGGVSRHLTVKAVQTDSGALQVEIAQIPVAGTPEAEERARVLAGQKETASYALGVDFGRKLRQQPVEVDTDLLAQGFLDALAGEKTLLTEEELQGALAAVQNRLRALQVKEQADQRRELAEKNRKEGLAFLAENKTKEGVVTRESGLQYRVLTAGDGARPTLRDTVVCHYRGTLLDGTEFDSSHGREKPGTFPLNRVIKGWREALQLMPVGSKWQLFIPPRLAYGVRGTRGVGPNATLVFEVELLSIKQAPDVGAR
jgi:FKBP-type peptidyl-prolyl cis-trans isomerase